MAEEDDEAEVKTAQYIVPQRQPVERMTSDQARQKFGPKPPEPDVMEGLDMSGARHRKTMTFEERQKAAAKRRETIQGTKDLMGSQAFQADPFSKPGGNAEVWKNLISSMSPTHKQWAIDLHAKLREAGFPKGLATDPQEMRKRNPAAADAVDFLLKHTMPHWISTAKKKTGHERGEPLPGSDFMPPPPGVGPRGGSLQDFEDVIPQIGGIKKFAEAEEPSDEAAV